MILSAVVPAADLDRDPCRQSVIDPLGEGGIPGLDRYGDARLREGPAGGLGRAGDVGVGRGIGVEGEPDPSRLQGPQHREGAPPGRDAGDRDAELAAQVSGDVGL